MTVKPENDTVTLSVNLEARNKEVAKAYNKIVQGAAELLKPFQHVRYRTTIEIDHSKSGKETNLIKEFICCFFNITLSNNRAGYLMLYVNYDEDAIAKFGARLYNRVLRQLFKHTMYEKTKLNIEDCVRVNGLGQVQNFFVNRLTNGENDFVAISVVDKD